MQALIKQNELSSMGSLLVNYLMQLDAKGLFALGFVCAVLNYLFILTRSKNKVLAGMSIVIRLVGVVFLFWGALVSASTIGDVASNLSVIVSMIIVCFGLLFGMVFCSKLPKIVS